MLKARRADLHARFADWLEREAGERVGEYDEILGYHLERAYRYLSELGPVDERARELGARAAARLGSSGGRALARGDIRSADEPARAGRRRCSTPTIRPGATSRSSSASRWPRGRAGAFVVFHDAGGGQHVVELRRRRSTIGRRTDNDVALSWDKEVSRRHAQLAARAGGLGARRRRLAQRLLPERRADHRAAARCATATSCASATRWCCSARRPPRRPARPCSRGGPGAGIMADVTASDLKARLEAERTGHPFLVYHDGEQRQRLFALEADVDQASIGRRELADVVLDWDDQVSRLHALLERVERGLDGRRRRPVAQRHVRERRAHHTAGAACRRRHAASSAPRP